MRRRSTAAIDTHVGARIRERRVLLGLSQGQLAEVIGVSDGQVHKYERGLSRLSAGTLYEIAFFFNEPISYFYDGLDEEAPRRAAPHRRVLLETTRNFAAIENEKHQEAFSQLVRVLAGRER